MSRSSQQLASEVDRPDPVLSAYELGQTIREMRIALQRDINDVAADLRIKVGYLKAIEDGRFRDLPGPAYATGFVRAYADYLGADSAEVVRLYKEAIGGGESRTALVLPSPVEEGRLPTGSVLLVAGILAICAYGGWYYLSLKGQDALDVVASVPDQVDRAIRGERSATPVNSASIDLRQARQAGAVPATPASTGPSVPPREAAAPVAVARVDMPKPVEIPPPPPEPPEFVAESAEKTPPQRVADRAAAPHPEPAVVPPAETAVASPAIELAEAPVRPTVSPPPPAAPDIEPVAISDLPTVGEGPAVAPARVAGIETPPVRTAPPSADVAVAGPPIVLSADSPSWVEVRDGRDQPVYSGLLRAGETVNLPRLKGLTLATGNAGALQITIDGRRVPSLGPRGAIRRNISLDLESLTSAGR